MERRTQPGYEYHSCDFMDDGVYIDMNLLREYEDTGLAPEKIMELKERDATVILVDIRANKKDNGRLLFGTCPKCKKRVTNVEGGNFCLHCGQRLKWEE